MYSKNIFVFFILVFISITQQINSDEQYYEKTYNVISTYYNKNYYVYINIFDTIYNYNKLQYYELNFYDKNDSKFISHLIWKLPSNISGICLYTVENFNILIKNIYQIPFLIYQQKISADCSKLGLSNSEWYGYTDGKSVKTLYANNMYYGQHINKNNIYKKVYKKYLLPNNTSYEKIYNIFLNNLNSNNTNCQYIYDKC
jgi:hypothetical protein